MRETLYDNDPCGRHQYASPILTACMLHVFRRPFLVPDQQTPPVLAQVFSTMDFESSPLDQGQASSGFKPIVMCSDGSLLELPAREALRYTQSPWMLLRLADRIHGLSMSLWSTLRTCFSDAEEGDYRN
jgi:hypothetical protein